MTLSEIIALKICKDGPISFCEFMEMCLYYPGLGYYDSSKEKIGWNGDYYTSPYLTGIFGQMVGKQIEEMWQILGKSEFTIVEFGAGTGDLCRGILEQLQKNKELYEKLNYCIIEKSAAMREKEKTTLPEKVIWYDSIKNIPPFSGCVLSNEVADNFSVHQVVMQEELMEVFVDFNNEFVEILKPAFPELKEYFQELNIYLEKNYRTEINLQAITWLKKIAESLQKGFVITIDYGFPSMELYSSHRSRGTLLCYHKHRINDCPYKYIGEQDITAHVNFSALHHWGKKSGLQLSGFTNQAYFLLSLGLAEHLREIEQNEKDNIVEMRNKVLLINSLLMDMGTKLKVLIQHKGIPKPQLSSLNFSSQVIL